MKSKKKLVLIPSAYNQRAMGDIENFIPLYKELFDVYVITKEKRESNDVVIGGVHYVRSKTKIADYLILTADYIIDAGAINGSSKYCATQKRISVWHGTPYKSMFTDLGPEYAISALNYCEGVDLMVSPSSWYSKRFLRQSMLYRGEIVEAPLSRTDSLFIDKEQAEKIKRILRIPKDKKILLYAPTFRESGAIELPFSPKRALAALGDDWVIVTKLHYLNSLSRDENVIDATQYPSVNNLLAIANLMVTDYSSLVFDYSVLQKPCLLFQYDRHEYEADRTFMFQMEDYIPEEDIIFREDDFYRRLKDAAAISPNLEALRQEFYPHQEPHATEALVDQLGLDHTEREVPEVIFLVNQLNQIGGVHTFASNLAREFKQRYNAKVMLFGNQEFDYSKDGIYEFDPENLFDVKLSAEHNMKLAASILKNTNGYIISCQYGVHRKFQRYLKNKKSILMFHGDTKDIVNRTLYRVHLDGYNENKVKNYRRLVLLTKGNCDLLKEHLRDDLREIAVYLENGIDFSNSKNLYAENGEFAFISRLDEDKNPLEVLDIFSDKDLNPKYHLHIYGDGSLKGEMQRIIEDRGLSDRVTMHGYVGNKEEIYRNKQGVLSTSLTEGLPYTILESFKYGVPVYAYDSFTACADMISEETGVLIKAGDKRAFIAALNAPFDIKRYCNDKAITQFSNASVVHRWKSLFDELDTEVSLEEAEKMRLAASSVSSKASKKKKRKKTTLRENALRVVRGLPMFRGNQRYAELAVRWKNIRRRETMQDKPLVSIIMPYYHNAETIQAAVRSVDKCGYPNYEIILVNDGSPDNPMEGLRYARKVRYFLKENGGCGNARNFGIKQARGKYVLYLDSDDLMYPGGLNSLVKYAEKHELEMVSGITLRWYIKQQKQEIWYQDLYEKTHVNSFQKRYQILDDTLVSGKLYRRDMLERLGMSFTDELYEDVRYTGKLYAKLDRIGIVAAKTQRWMVYGTNTSITTSATLANVKARIQSADEVFDAHPNVNRAYLTRQFIRHHMVASLNGYMSLSDKEKRELYNTLKAGIEKRQDYIVDRLIVVPAKKLLYKSLLDDDFELFTLLAEGFSNEYLALHNA